MLRKYFLFGIILLNFFALSTLTNAKRYNFIIEENSDFTYKIISFDEDLADEYLDKNIVDIFGYSAEVGAYKYYRIIKILESNNLTSKYDKNLCIGWKIDVEEWGWITDIDWRNYRGDPDEVYQSLSIYSDPNDLGVLFDDIALLIPPYFITTPAEDYLDSINWSEGYDIHKNMTYIEYEVKQGKIVKELHIFTSEGYLQKKILYTNDERVIYEYELVNEPLITIDWFLILSITAIFSIFLFEIIHVIKMRNKYTP